MVQVKADAHADTPLQLITSYLQQAKTAQGEEKDALIDAALDLAAHLDDYLTLSTTPATQELNNMIDATLEQDWDALHASGKTQFKYTSNFCAGTFEAQFVSTLCQLVQAKEVLEIGMFTGTTAGAIAQALPANGRVTTCEIDPFLKTHAEAQFSKAGLQDKIEVVLGSAHDSLPLLAKQGRVYDLIFLDAEKVGYLAYFQKVMELGLLAPTGAFVVDNTLFKGHVYRQGEDDEMTTALKHFNETVKQDPRVHVILLPIRDGVSIITHKPAHLRSEDPVVSGYLGQSMTQRFKLTGKSALVTGAAQGLGRSYAHALSQAGAAVMVADLSFEAADKVAEEIRAMGGRASAVAADVTDKAACDAMVKACVDTFGKLDIAVNNAGVNLSSPAEDSSAAEFETTMSVNVKGVFFSCQAEAAHMLDKQDRVIINVASMSAVAMPHPQKQMLYNTSKAAVKKMTESLAVEWGSRGIRVNAIAPGIVKTDLITKNESLGPLLETWLKQIPLGRLAEFDDCQGTIVFLASDLSRYMNGTTQIIDGGQQFL
ncbi:NAD(P)-binding protein [Protomyces lactucae-debilis]|uniref:D-arabinitol 2-dehydrogenase [ribulose-forming] n=1 Tax=Protomyces lactucae-debilis TaxID=2754530 RepID=A0A1Y2FDJ3_PROLT|nr:NAD(P)-binding protein [Protomyces lactucae-debilis]ORY81998.1 NAD(P)-binding protein [Protomyces lactucae-debilis]